MIKIKKTIHAKPVWLKISEEEMAKIISELAEKYSPAQIGTILRDQYGIPTTKVFGKKLSHYLKEINKDVSFELKSAEKKVDVMKLHLKKNVTDKKAEHKLQKARSHLNSIRKYLA